MLYAICFDRCEYGTVVVKYVSSIVIYKKNEKNMQDLLLYTQFTSFKLCLHVSWLLLFLESLQKCLTVLISSKEPKIEIRLTKILYSTVFHHISLSLILILKYLYSEIRFYINKKRFTWRGIGNEQWKVNNEQLNVHKSKKKSAILHIEYLILPHCSHFPKFVIPKFFKYLLPYYVNFQYTLTWRLNQFCTKIVSTQEAVTNYTKIMNDLWLHYK